MRDLFYIAIVLLKFHLYVLTMTTNTHRGECYIYLLALLIHYVIKLED